MRVPPPHHDPAGVVDGAANAAMDAAATHLRGQGAEMVSVVVILHARDVPAGQLDSTVSGHSEDADPGEGLLDASWLVAELIAAATAALRSVGKDLKIMRLGQG